MGFLSKFERAETADRRHVIGASAAPVILGLSPWQTPMGLFLQMQDGGDIADNEAMERGRFLESSVLAWTGARTGAKAIEPGIPLDEPGIAGPEPFMQFHPDGAFWYDNPPYRADSAFWRVAEIKTARQNNGWGEDGTDQIPPYYLAQVQFQLACLPGVKEAQVGVYIGSEDKLRTYVVKSDHEFQRFMVEAIGEWCYRSIVLGQAPALDGSAATATYLQRKFPKPLLGIRPAVASEAALVSELASVKQAIAASEARESELTNLLRDAIGEAEGVEVEGVGKVTWRHVSGGATANMTKLRGDFPEVWEQVKRIGADRRDVRFWPAKG